MYGGGEYYIYMGIAAVLSIVGGLISARLRSKFNAYAKVSLRNGLSGAEIAAKMLRDYNIGSVRIVEGRGFLTDHYNPGSKTISLSPQVYHGRSVAAAAVAAHECGHAVQHDVGYSMLQVRSALVPIVHIASQWQQYVLLFAFVMFNTFPQMMLIAILLFGATTLFSLVTLPVEFDASKRALAWLESERVAVGTEYEGAKDALWWAAMTYVAAALSSLIMLLYLILRYRSRR